MNYRARASKRKRPKRIAKKIAKREGFLHCQDLFFLSLLGILSAAYNTLNALGAHPLVSTSTVVVSPTAATFLECAGDALDRGDQVTLDEMSEIAVQLAAPLSSPYTTDGAAQLQAALNE